MLYKLSLINSILAVCVQETYSSLNLTGNLCFYSLQMVCRKNIFSHQQFSSQWTDYFLEKGDSNLTIL